MRYSPELTQIRAWFCALLLILASASRAAGAPGGQPAHGDPPAPALPSPPLIAAFYYPWYGAPATDGGWLHWQQFGHAPPRDIASDFFPVLGAYSSNDPAVLEQHMRWLRRAGVELIITSWWGQGSYEDRAVPALLAAAENNGIGVAFHLEPYRGRSAEQLAADVAYLYRQYGSSPGFYRTDAGSLHNMTGKWSGLFFVWNPFVRYTGGPRADAAYWRAGLEQIHALPEGGVVFVHATDPAWIEEGQFDGAYNYTERTADLQLWGQQLPDGAWYAPSIIPGFSARRAGYPAAMNLARQAGETYDSQWRAVLETGFTPQIVTITSFNEWHEGTQIEPAVAERTDDGSYTYAAYARGPLQYLAATARWAARARALAGYVCAPAIAVALRAENQPDGLYQHDREDGATVAQAIAGRAARQMLPNRFGTARYLYLWVQREFQYQAAGAVRVAVTYFDRGDGEFSLDYDSADETLPFAGAYKRTAAIPLTNSDRWRTATFELPDAYFGDRQNDGADLRIVAPALDLAVAKVTVEKLQAPCPPRLFLPLIAGE